MLKPSQGQIFNKKKKETKSGGLLLGGHFKQLREKHQCFFICSDILSRNDLCDLIFYLDFFSLETLVNSLQTCDLQANYTQDYRLHIGSSDHFMILVAKMPYVRIML